MTLEQMRAKLKECLNKALISDLNWAIVFFYSPVSEEVECRTIYSDERNEVLNWIEAQANFYSYSNIAFTSYMNDGVYRSELTVPDNKILDQFNTEIAEQKYKQ